MPFTKVDHKFIHPELDYDSTPNFQPCIKVSVFFKKLDSIDYDTFFGHWQTVHADLAVATQAFRKHIVRYCQVSCCPVIFNCISCRDSKGFELLDSIHIDYITAPSNNRNETASSESRRECSRL